MTFFAEDAGFLGEALREVRSGRVIVVALVGLADLPRVDLAGLRLVDLLAAALVLMGLIELPRDAVLLGLLETARPVSAPGLVGLADLPRVTALAELLLTAFSLRVLGLTGLIDLPRVAFFLGLLLAVLRLAALALIGLIDFPREAAVLAGLADLAGLRLIDLLDAVEALFGDDSAGTSIDGTTFRRLAPFTALEELVFVAGMQSPSMQVSNFLYNLE